MGAQEGLERIGTRGGSSYDRDRIRDDRARLGESIRTMTATSSPGQTATEVRRRGVETTGIEIIDESARTARPHDLFWPWFAANVSVFGISYGAYVLGFGISFAQAAVVAVVGVILSFALCGIIAIAGKRGSAPTMILSRAAFGVQGQKVPGVMSWLVSIGW